MNISELVFASPYIQYKRLEKPMAIGVKMLLTDLGE
jgi:hypothetical protein